MKRPRRERHPDKWNGKPSNQRTEFSAADRLGLRHKMMGSIIQAWADTVGIDLDSMETVIYATETSVLIQDINRNTMECVLSA